MNSTLALRGLALGLPLLVLPVLAQELRPAPGFWFRTGGVLRSGYDVRFVDAAAPLPGGAGSFADGFVLPSISTNSTHTWNWGYQDAAQVSGGNLQLQRYDSAPRVGSVDGGSQTTYGGEIRAGFEAIRFELFGRDVRFGFEGGYSYGEISASASGRASGLGSYSTASYPLVGPGGQAVIPPLPPYAGTFGGPGPLIPLTPSVSGTQTGAGTAGSEFSLDATVHTFKVGPYFEVPLSRRWIVGLSFGYCTVLPDAEFQYRDVTTFPGTGIPDIREERTARRSDWQPGGYAELRAIFEINRRFALYVAGEFQYNEDLRFGAGGREAVIGMGGVYGATGGLRISF